VSENSRWRNPMSSSYRVPAVVQPQSVTAAPVGDPATVLQRLRFCCLNFATVSRLLTVILKKTEEFYRFTLQSTRATAGEIFVL